MSYRPDTRTPRRAAHLTASPSTVLALTVLALTMLALTVGCGAGGGHGGRAGHDGGPSSGASANPTRNGADVSFADHMIPHHQQAVEMAALARTRAARAQVRDLAATIERAQAPEIALMTGWLTEWGVAASAPAGGHDPHAGMPGMMSEGEMAALKAADGAAFDRMFLQLMIRHHEGAVQMARTAQQQGQNADARALAKKIETDQAAEIVTMRTLLAG